MFHRPTCSPGLNPVQKPSSSGEGDITRPGETGMMASQWKTAYPYRQTISNLAINFSFAGVSMEINSWISPQ